MHPLRLNESYVICLALLSSSIVTCCKACNPAEYEIDGECCPMCSPGHCVLTHCDSYSSTDCKVCTGSTYTNEPNGLTACLTCTVCEEVDNGLRVKRACKYNSDAICEPLPGHYCIESQGESCNKAREHSSCLPGQYIYHIGTALNDTVCKLCSEKTYSNGSLMHCEPHTDCESLGLITITPGTQSSDAVCSHKPLHLGLIFGISVAVILFIVILSVFLWMKKEILGIL